MKKTKYLITAITFLACLIMIKEAAAYIIPENNAKIKYFYVFGQQGNPDYGSEPDHDLTFYIDIPQDAVEDLVIDIFDPDTGGKIDYSGGVEIPWDTQTEFTVYGRNNTLLNTKRFAEDRKYDSKYFRFGPYLKNQGEKLADVYRFKLDVKALGGRNGNLFNIRVSPDSARTFAYKLAFRLLEKEGEEMYLYPEISVGTTRISVENYDMDIDGGKSALYDPETKKYHDIQDSLSGLWAQTDVPILATQTRRLQYVITKKTQHNANAAAQFKDEKGNFLPIYFQDGKYKPEVMAVQETPNSSCRVFTFDATESYDPNNQKLSYYWDFGDGTISTEPVVIHNYEKSGEYTVVLKVKNISGLECDTAVTSKTVAVNSPPQAVFISPEVVCNNQEVIFDASSTTDNTPDQLTYQWDFGDGTRAEGKRVSKVYKQGGMYRVTLTVNDNAGTSCSVARAVKNITVNAPIAIGTYEDIDMSIPLDQEYKVAFSFIEKEGQRRGNLKYTWDFGDGTVAEGNKVSHIYKQGGEYTATLTVDDGLGLPCSSGATTFNVRLSKQPQADADGNKVVCLGNSILFDGSRSRGENTANLTYSWDFGDGTPEAQGIKANHRYEKPGNYKATLTVYDKKSRKSVPVKDSVSVLVNTKLSLVIREVKNTCVGKGIDFACFLNESEGAYLKKGALKYTWDFGDGSVVEGGSIATHAYRKGGEYLVKVTADDQLGTACSVDTQSIRVKINVSPTANTGPNLVCCDNIESVFDGSSSSDPDGDLLSYTWDFGDGDTAKGARVTHIYKKRGKYKVVLKVDDNSGTDCSSSTASVEVSVSEKPVSVIKIR